MADRLYLERNEQNFGPYSAAQLKELAAAGRLRPTDLVRREGLKKGVPAANLKSLFPAPQAGVSAANAVVPPNARGDVDGLVADIVPEGLKLRPIPEQIDLDPVLAPDLTFAPSPESTKVSLAARDKPNAEKGPARRRAVAVSGAVIMSQDGASVTYRKKCRGCGYQDSVRTSMRIGIGITCVAFFCPKCRKMRDVQIQGVA